MCNNAVTDARVAMQNQNLIGKTKMPHGNYVQVMKSVAPLGNFASYSQLLDCLLPDPFASASCWRGNSKIAENREVAGVSAENFQTYFPKGKINLSYLNPPNWPKGARKNRARKSLHY